MDYLVLINKWVDEKLITKKIAAKMLVDIENDRKNQSQNMFIVAISVIGAILLGVGAILFVSANWEQIPSLWKVIMLLSASLTAYICGCYFKYGSINFPRVGGSLIFLSTLLIGATIFLVAQIYNIEANAHILVLLWIISILPVVYLERSNVLTILEISLLYVWISSFLFQNENFFQELNNQLNAIVFLMLIVIFSVILFQVGTLHRMYESVSKMGRHIRLLSTQVALLFIFILSFKDVSNIHSRNYYSQNLLDMINNFNSVDLFVKTPLGVFILIALFFIGVNYLGKYQFFANNIDEKMILIVNVLVLSVISIFALNPFAGMVHTIIFNLFMFGVIIFALKVGYDRHDLSLVNLGMFLGGALILARYFDVFWNMLSTSLFFVIGGVILISGSVFLERKRRGLKKEFKTDSKKIKSASRSKSLKSKFTQNESSDVGINF